MKSERIFLTLVASILIIWLTVIVFKNITTEKVKTPYGIYLTLSKYLTFEKYSNIEYYTFEGDFIYFYEKVENEP